MKRLLRCFLLCLAMLALPVQGIAGTVMMICSAAPATGVGAMMSRHAAVKAQIETQWSQEAEHAHCHDGEVVAPAATPTDAEHTGIGPDDGDHGAGHQHASTGCAACASCALGAALPLIPAELALSHFRQTPPLSTPATLADISLDSFLRPPATRC